MTTKEKSIGINQVIEILELPETNKEQYVQKFEEHGLNKKGLNPISKIVEALELSTEQAEKLSTTPSKAKDYKIEDIVSLTTEQVDIFSQIKAKKDEIKTLESQSKDISKKINDIKKHFGLP